MAVRSPRSTEGKSIDTSMGFTPLEGLVMGTRSGDVDPPSSDYLAERENVAGRSGRMAQRAIRPVGTLRTIQRHAGVVARRRAGRGPARRIRHRSLLLQSAQISGRLPGRIGWCGCDRLWRRDWENAPEVRKRICRNMEWCGMNLHPDRNRSAVGLNRGRRGRSVGMIQAGGVCRGGGRRNMDCKGNGSLSAGDQLIILQAPSA